MIHCDAILLGYIIISLQDKKCKYGIQKLDQKPGGHKHHRAELWQVARLKMQLETYKVNISYGVISDLKVAPMRFWGWPSMEEESKRLNAVVTSSCKRSTFPLFFRENTFVRSRICHSRAPTSDHSDPRQWSASDQMIDHGGKQTLDQSMILPGQP